MDSPESWRTYQSRGVLLVFIFGFSMLSYGSIPVIESTKCTGQKSAMNNSVAVLGPRR